MVTCLRCRSVLREEQGRERVNHEEYIDFTHRCTNKECEAVYRVEPPTMKKGSNDAGE